MVFPLGSTFALVVTLAGGRAANSCAPGMGGGRKEDEGEGKGEDEGGVSRERDSRGRVSRDRISKTEERRLIEEEMVCSSRAEPQPTSWPPGRVLLKTNVPVGSETVANKDMGYRGALSAYNTISYGPGRRSQRSARASSARVKGALCVFMYMHLFAAKKKYRYQGEHMYKIANLEALHPRNSTIHPLSCFGFRSAARRSRWLQK
jgi:hypothetical protein